MFRALFQSWLRQTAQQKVQQELLSAARQQLEAAAAKSPGEAPAVCDFAVIFALGIEAGGLVDLMSEGVTLRGQGFIAREGEIKGRVVVIVESGAGQARAARAAEAIIDGHRPRWVVSAGFAGALAPELRRGDILVADQLVDEAGGRWAAEPGAIPGWIADVRGVRVGRLLTADRVVRLAEEKRALGTAHAALAVDMESLAVAEVCRRRGVRFLAIRVVNDAVDDELPRDVERLLRQKTGAARLGAALGSVLHRPGSIKDLFRLRENALAASDRLAKYLAGLMKHL